MIDILLTALQQLANVLLVGLVLGAGLPALFAAGMKALMLDREISADGQALSGRASRRGLALAAVCFGVVVAATLFGIVVIVYGNQLFGKH